MRSQKFSMPWIGVAWFGLKGPVEEWKGTDRIGAEWKGLVLFLNNEVYEKSTRNS